MHPTVLLLDEPLGALDLKVRKELQIELKRIQEEVGITFVYVTHDQEEALAMSDRVAVMNARPDRADRTLRTRSTTGRRPSSSRASSATRTSFGWTDERGRGATGAAPAWQRAATGLRGRRSTTTMVIGPAVQCVVRLDDGQEVLAREQRSGADAGAEALAEGERVVGVVGRRRGPRPR